MATFIVNSSLSGDEFYARVFNIADGTDATLDATEYPENGTVDFGTDKGADTQYIPKPGDSIYWIQKADNIAVYQIFGLDIISQTISDVYWGDQDTPVALIQSGKEYVLPLTTWKMLEAIPDAVLPLGGLDVK